VILLCTCVCGPELSCHAANTFSNRIAGKAARPVAGGPGRVIEQAFVGQLSRADYKDLHHSPHGFAYIKPLSTVAHGKLYDSPASFLRSESENKSEGHLSAGHPMHNMWAWPLSVQSWPKS
jgi:hypothetical protein